MVLKYDIDKQMIMILKPYYEDVNDYDFSVVDSDEINLG
jgi:hypothetical protein